MIPYIRKYVVFVLLFALLNINSFFFTKTLFAGNQIDIEDDASVETVEYSTGSGGDTQPAVIEEKIVKVEKKADKYDSVPKILIGAVVYVISLPFRLIAIIFQDRVE